MTLLLGESQPLLQPSIPSRSIKIKDKSNIPNKQKAASDEGGNTDEEEEEDNVGTYYHHPERRQSKNLSRSYGATSTASKK